MRFMYEGSHMFDSLLLVFGVYYLFEPLGCPQVHSVHPLLPFSFFLMIILLIHLSGRIAIALWLGNSAVFFSLWLGFLSTFSGRIAVAIGLGNSVAFINLGFFKMWILGISATPIDLNQLSPYSMSLREFFLFSSSKLIFSMINWVIQSPFLISNWMSEWLIRSILTSPL